MSAAALTLDYVRAFIWPAVLVGAGFAFRGELRDFAGRLTKVRVGGQEFIAATLDRSQILLRSIPLSDTRPEAVPRDLEDKLTSLAKSDPHGALSLLNWELERNLRYIALSGNWFRALDPNEPWRRVLNLASNVGWSVDVTAFVLIFAILNDAVLNEGLQLTDADLQKLIDQGLTVLGLVASIQMSKHVVVASRLPVFEDEQLARRTDRFAVLLKEVVPDDGRETKQPFYTAKPDYYRPGMTVSYGFREDPPKEQPPGWIADPTNEGVALGVVPWTFDGEDMAPFERPTY